MTGLRLYHYWRSSSSWRVRWALDLKKIPHELVAVSLVNGESESPEHLKRHPMGYVPVLETPRGFLGQSAAIIHWLEATFPETPRLFPSDTWNHSRVIQLADMISADTQPIQNIPVLQRHSADPAEQKKWAQHFIHSGLAAFEAVAASTAGRFSVGDGLTYADLCLLPQLYNAHRYEVPLSDFPLLQRIASECEKLPSYQSSHPSRHEPKP